MVKTKVLYVWHKEHCNGPLHQHPKENDLVCSECGKRVQQPVSK